MGLVSTLSLGCSAMEPAPLPDYADDDPAASQRDAGKVDAGKVVDGGRLDAGRADGGMRDAGSAPSARLYCKARAVLDAHCVSCHDGEGTEDSPMALVRYADLTARSPSNARRRVYQLVADRIHDEEKPMPPAGLLEPAQLADLDDWIAAGAKDDSGGSCSAD